jgi:hypothetical protein
VNVVAELLRDLEAQRRVLIFVFARGPSFGRPRIECVSSYHARRSAQYEPEAVGVRGVLHVDRTRA